MEEKVQTNINVNGDNVREKRVQYEIGNVENGGIGIQIVNGKQASSTLPSTKNKTITPKKSKHFLETATFKYRYLNTDEGNRRLYLLYQFLGSKQDLYYLIKRMVERRIINIPDNATIWTITQNHFSDRRGNIFLDLRNQHKPKTSAEAIEHLIDILDPAATTPADLTELSKKLSTAFGGK